MRNQRIDFLRGIAILLVLILHFHLSYPLDQSALSKIFSVTFIKSFSSNGNYGVIIFFVISGFLITSTSLERYGELRNIDITQFYIFRFARIMPCLFLTLILISVFNFLDILTFKNNIDTTSFFLGIFSVLTFWHNILMEKIGWFNYCLNILWSLSVEETFYFIFPIACLIFKKTRFIIPLWIAFVIIAPFYRNHYSSNELVALCDYISCFDAIAIGCCAAVIEKKIRLSRWFCNTLQYGSGWLLAAIYLYAGIMEHVAVAISLMAIGTAVWLICAKQKEHEEKNNRSNVINQVVCWFGKNSYELYLFHIIVLALMREIYAPKSLENYSALFWMGIFFSVSAMVAGGVEKYYSQPSNKIIRKYLTEKFYANRIMARRQPAIRAASRSD